MFDSLQNPFSKINNISLVAFIIIHFQKLNHKKSPDLHSGLLKVFIGF
jgi:hypothetical protein